MRMSSKQDAHTHNHCTWQNEACIKNLSKSASPHLYLQKQEIRIGLELVRCFSFCSDSTITIITQLTFKTVEMIDS